MPKGVVTRHPKLAERAARPCRTYNCGQPAEARDRYCLDCQLSGAAPLLRPRGRPRIDELTRAARAEAQADIERIRAEVAERMQEDG